MRIAFVSVFHPYRGGISQFNGHIYRELQKEHTVKAINFSLQYPDFLFPGKSQFVDPTDLQSGEVEAPRLLNSINPLSYLTTAKEIKRFKPDLLITRYWMPFFGPSLGTVAHLTKRHNTKVVAIIDNLIPHEPRFFDAPFTRYFLNAVDSCLCMSEAVASDIRTVAPHMPVWYHPHPVYDHFGEIRPKAQARAALNIPKDKTVLLFFGLIRAYKGLDLLLQAFPKLGENVYLLVVGEPYENFDPYQQLIDEGGAKNRIQVHTRYIPTEEVSTFFSAADIGVLPYRTATQSGIAAMAFHFNLPVVVTDTGGLKQMIEPHGIGRVVPTVSVEALIKTLQDVLTMPSAVQEIRDNIVAFKQQNNWQTFSNKILEAYKNLL